MGLACRAALLHEPQPERVTRRPPPWLPGPQNETRGIDVRHFGELLTVSGVVLNEDVSGVLLSKNPGGGVPGWPGQEWSWDRAGLQPPAPPKDGDHTLCLMCPRIVLPAPPPVRWITFHSGYDFGYLLKLLTCQSLPANEGEFFQLLKVRRHHRAGC